MKRITVVCLTLVGAALSLSAAAQAYTRPTDPSYVAVVGCFSRGGEQAVPADTPITVFGGWGASHPGLVEDWLHGSVNTISVNGGPAVDLSSYFAGITDEWNPPDWADIFFYPIGQLAVGQTVTVAYTYTIEHRLTDGINGFANPGDSETFRCTITGV